MVFEVASFFWIPPLPSVRSDPEIVNEGTAVAPSPITKPFTVRDPEFGSKVGMAEKTNPAWSEVVLFAGADPPIQFAPSDQADEVSPSQRINEDRESGVNAKTNSPIAAWRKIGDFITVSK